MWIPRPALLALTLVLPPGGAFAQPSEPRPAPAVELLAGYAGFVDDATIDHSILGAAGRVYLTPRLGVGPELVSMVGPNSDRDLYLTVNLTFDVMRPRRGRPRRVTPFLVAGGGFFQHSDRVGTSVTRRMKEPSRGVEASGAGSLIISTRSQTCDLAGSCTCGSMGALESVSRMTGDGRS